MTDDQQGQIIDDQDEEEFDLSLTGTGISLSRKVNRDAALQILAIAMGGRGGFSTSPTYLQQGQRQQPKSARGDERVSLREYLNDVGAKRNPDKILAIGKYLLAYRGQESFTRDQVKGQFRAAGEAIPANFPRDFRRAVTNGWIAEDHAAPGEYYITASGDEALAAHFSSQIKKKTGQSKLARRRKKKTADSDSEE